VAAEPEPEDGVTATPVEVFAAAAAAAAAEAAAAAAEGGTDEVLHKGSTVLAPGERLGAKWWDG
jgi:hypothetical protein